MLGETNEWYQESAGPGGISKTNYYTEPYNEVAGVKYFKLFSRLMVFEPRLIGFLMEDVVEKRVYFFSPDSTDNLDSASKRLIYDFTLVEGDTISLPNPWQNEDSILRMDTLVVDSIGEFNECLKTQNYSPFVNGDRKIFNLRKVDQRPYKHKITWVEGIGSTAGLLNNKIEGSECLGPDAILNCHFKNGILQYKKGSISSEEFCFYIPPISKPDFMPELIFPNPVISQVNINLALLETEIHTIHILSIDSRLLLSATPHYDNSIVTIPLTDFPAGVYLIQMIGGGGTYFDRIVKN